MKPKPVKRLPTEADILLWDQLVGLRDRCLGRFKPAKEWSFYEGRKWKLDFVLLPVSPSIVSMYKIAVEIEGGIWVKGGGGHNRGKAFLDDCEKYNHAAMMGFKVLRFSPRQVLDGTAIAFIKRVLDT